MRATLGLQVSVRVRTVDRERRAAEARLIAGRRLEELGLEVTALRPAQVHANEHLGPIRGVRTADARADRDHGVAFVVRARELRFEARDLDLVSQTAQLFRDLGFEGRVLVGDRGELSELLHASAKPFPSVETRARAPESFEELLRALTILPEVGLRRLCF